PTRHDRRPFGVHHQLGPLGGSWYGRRLGRRFLGGNGLLGAFTRRSVTSPRRRVGGRPFPDACLAVRPSASSAILPSRPWAHIVQRVPGRGAGGAPKRWIGIGPSTLIGARPRVHPSQ